MSNQIATRIAMRRNIAITLLLLTASGQLFAQNGTVMPTPFQTVFDNSGHAVSNAKVCTYVAGTTTPVATYSDRALTTANQNPIRTDAAGRFVAYLSPGASYKFVYQDASGTAGVCDGASFKTIDNVAAVPSSSASLEVVGTAGETLTAGQAAYLSDGSGSKVAGQWYKADSSQAYSSIFPEVGLVPATVVSGSSGTIRLAGQATGLSSLSVGSTYYVGSAGALTLTAPALARKLGVADSTSTLVLKDISAPTQPWVNDFRLTLTTAVPVTMSDVTGASAVTIYASPYVGNRLDLPDSNGTPSRLTCAEFSIAVPATTNTVYDIFAFNNAGACALELLSWSNDTTRSTNVVRTTNGRPLKSGDNTRMYLGVFRTGAVSGQTEDSAAKRWLQNYYNRVQKPVAKTDATASWPYTIATYRQARADATNQIDVLNGLGESTLWLQLTVMASNTNGGGTGVHLNAGIGEDSTTVPVATAVAYINIFTATTTTFAQATLVKAPAIGRHFYAWIEGSEAVGTSTWYGTNAGIGGATTANGLNGLWWC